MLKNFIIKYRWWLIIIIAFLAIRVLVFSTFWQASLDKGGWENFYKNAQAAPAVLEMRFHETCDWHPPLYYTFTSVLLFLFKNQWAIYISQILLMFLTLIASYKLVKLFFSERVALWAVFLLAIEPYWAWHNFLLVSENLSTPLLLFGLFYFFRFIRSNTIKHIAYSAIFLGLATLTRPNYLLLPLFISILFFLIFALKKWSRLWNEFNLNFGQFLKYFILFNLIFFVVLTPWIVHNKIVYGRLTIANMMSTNVYAGNLPPFLAWQRGISYESAFYMIMAQARADLGDNIVDFNSCGTFSREEFNRQLDYFERESNRYILSDPVTYAEVHLARAVPFFFQPGYFEMWSAYSGEFNKPDLTALIMERNFDGVKKFLGGLDLKVIIYILGVIFWGICSLAVLVSCIYSYFKDKSKFVFLLFLAGIIVYNALIISPFVLARYRLPIYILFFAPLVYMTTVLWHKLSPKEHV